jgi:hypothetical protein
VLISEVLLAARTVVPHPPTPSSSERGSLTTID